MTRSNVNAWAIVCATRENISASSRTRWRAISEIPRTALTDIENGQRRVEAIELTRLAKLYRQSVAYFTGEDEASASLPPDVAHLARRVADLSSEDRAELGRFAEYLRSRSAGGQA